MREDGLVGWSMQTKGEKRLCRDREQNNKPVKLCWMRWIWRCSNASQRLLFTIPIKARNTHPLPSAIDVPRWGSDLLWGLWGMPMTTQCARVSLLLWNVNCLNATGLKPKPKPKSPSFSTSKDGTILQEDIPLLDIFRQSIMKTNNTSYTQHKLYAKTGELQIHGASCSGTFSNPPITRQSSRSRPSCAICSRMITSIISSAGRPRKIILFDLSEQTVAAGSAIGRFVMATVTKFAFAQGELPPAKEKLGKPAWALSLSEVSGFWRHRRNGMAGADLFPHRTGRRCRGRFQPA